MGLDSTPILMVLSSKALGMKESAWVSGEPKVATTKLQMILLSDLAAIEAKVVEVAVIGLVNLQEL